MSLEVEDDVYGSMGTKYACTCAFQFSGCQHSLHFLFLSKNYPKYYRDAVNHYYEAYHWANRVQPVEEDFVPSPERLAVAAEEPHFTQEELDELRSVICSNCALAHMCLKNWGHVRDESKKVSLGL